MKPQLPPDDLKLIEDISKKPAIRTALTLNEPIRVITDKEASTMLSIISRLQSALDEACRQRDEEMQYNPMSKSTKEMWRDRKNNQIKEILEGK